MPKKFIRVCPKCLSTDVVPDLSANAYARGSIFNQYRCNNCEYTEIYFPEITEEELKELKAKKHINKSKTITI